MDRAARANRRVAGRGAGGGGPLVLSGAVSAGGGRAAANAAAHAAAALARRAAQASPRLDGSMNEHLDELMLRWDAARQQGGAVRPEELCADCPELAPALRERTEAVEAMERVLGVHPGEPERVPTLLAGTVASAHTAEPLPQIPGYEILRVLDQGGMRGVFQARQLDLCRIVAAAMVLNWRPGLQQA